MPESPAGRTFSSGVFETGSEPETEHAGEAFARTLSGAAVVHLYGDLGAGKTAFVRGMARGLGADPADVSSPTFTIIQEYVGTRATLFHVDLYRLTPPEIEDLGLDDLIDGGHVVAIEWADRWPGRPPTVTDVAIEHLGGDKRRIRISLPPDR